MPKLSIRDLDLADKRVFIRVDFNVPLSKEGTITDDTRIRETIPTIEYALRRKAKVILAAHLGRATPNPATAAAAAGDHAQPYAFEQHPISADSLRRARGLSMADAVPITGVRISDAQ